MEKIFGYHSVRAVFLTRPNAIKRIILLAGKKPHLNNEFLKLAASVKIDPEILTWKKFMHVTGLTEEEQKHQGPKNLATILRNAAFFGADAVIMMKYRSVDISPTVTRVAAGGAEFIKIFKVINLARSLDTLKDLGFWVYGLDERGEKTLAETDFAEKTVFVVGAEGQGLRVKTKKFCDVLVRIPGGRPGLESLNAGIASAVALAEFFR